MGDPFSDAGAELAGQHSSPFGWVTDEATFHQHGGIPGGIANDVKARVFGTAIRHAGALHEVGLNVRSQRLAGGMMVIGFDPGTAATAVVIVMQADEERVAVTVASGRAIWEGDEDISTASHDDFDAVFPEDFFNAAGGVQGQMFLINIADGRTTVMAAMARVQDHRIKSGGREAGCEGEQTEENPTAGECREK